MATLVQADMVKQATWVCLNIGASQRIVVLLLVFLGSPFQFVDSDTPTKHGCANPFCEKCGHPYDYFVTKGEAEQLDRSTRG